MNASFSLTRTEAYALMRCSGSDLLRLMQQAAALRDACKGKVITYSRKVFIPLTNLCRNQCAYCTFAVPPASPQASLLSPQQVLQIARLGAQARCKEALFSMGEKPEWVYPSLRRQLRDWGYPSLIHYLRAMCELVFRETGLIPHVNPGTMSEEEMRLLRPWAGSMGMMLENISPRLLQKGESHEHCVDKAPQRRLQTLENAGKLQVPFTTGILIGIGETPEERVDSLFAIAELQRRYGNIQEVIIQNFRPKPATRFANRPQPSLIEMLRTIAVARLILGGEMNLQAPPNLSPDAYLLYPLAGINDWGGISPLTIDYINPEAAWPNLEELRHLTAEAGFELRERLTIYPQYLSTTFVAPHIFQHVQSWLDERGLVQELLAEPLGGIG
jgi:FO synthase subunit 1